MKLPFSSKFDWNLQRLLQSKKIIFAFYLVCAIPFALLVFSISEQSKHFDDYAEQVARMKLRIERMLGMQKDRNAFYKQYGVSDRYYLDNVLEASTFLTPEKEALELVYSHHAFKSCDNVKKRLDFLTEGENRLMFSEENRRSQNKIEEVDLKQKRPIEINTEDLKKLLSNVEGVTIGAYQP